MKRQSDLEHPDSVPVVVLKPPLHDQIIPLLRRDIICGRWQPGQRLPEPLLCERFGVSRTPLRNAFGVLASEGLLKLLPNRGAVVTEPTAEDIDEKMKVLIELEGLAIATACAAASDAELATARRQHDRMMVEFDAHRPDRYYELNAQIHSLIVRLSRNKTLIGFHEIISGHIDRVRHIVNIGEELSERSKHEHQRIMETLAARDPEKSREAMRQHLGGVLDKIRRAFELKR